MNGIGACFEMLLPFIDAIPELDVILFDAPGAGKSAAPATPWRLARYAGVAAHVLDEYGVTKADVMGVSWGGALAQQFAKDYPERVGHLVLAVTTPGIIMVPGRLSALAHMWNPRRYFDKTYMKRIAGVIYGGKLRTNKLSAFNFAESTTPPSRRGYLYQMLAIARWSSLPWVRKLTVPTLVIQGEDDPLIPEANGRTLAAMIPGAKLMVVDCGHLCILTRARRVGAVVRRFLSLEVAAAA